MAEFASLNLLDELKFQSALIQLALFTKNMSKSVIDNFPGLTVDERKLMSTIHKLVYGNIINDFNLKVLSNIVKTGKDAAVTLVKKLSKEIKKNKEIKEKAKETLKQTEIGSTLIDKLTKANVINPSTLKIEKKKGGSKTPEEEEEEDERLYKKKAQKYKMKYLALKKKLNK